MHSQLRLHASCVADGDEALLMIGPPGSGKSDLVLRLLSRGFELVADDQVTITDGVASCSAALAGLLEVRGIGIVRLPYRPSAKVVLVVELGPTQERLPRPRRHTALQVPVLRLDPAAASAPDRVRLAFDCVRGRIEQVAGAFCE